MLNGAIIGFGKIAQTAHLPAYEDERIRSRARIVAAVDPNDKSRALASAEYPAIRFYDNFDALFKKKQIDFIDICAPPIYHPKLIEAGVRYGVPVLCEKPFAVSLADAERTADLLSKSSIIFMPCHQYRYSPIWSLFKQLLEEGKDESGWFLQFNVLRTQADRGSPSWNPAWRTDRQISGGGILADTGVHYLYLTSWLLGNPRTVTSRIHQLHHQVDGVEDSGFVFLEFPKGVAEINLTWAADRRANYARLVGHGDSIVYDGSNVVRYHGEQKEVIDVPDASDKRTYVSLYVSLFDEFLRAITNRTSSSNWIAEALQSVRMLETCYRSAREQHTISMSS